MKKGLSFGVACAVAKWVPALALLVACARPTSPRVDNCPPKTAFLPGVRLRGANVFQDDRQMPRLVRDDLRALRAAGANVVSFSVPGPWHVRGRRPWPEMRAHLDKLVGWAADEGLFAIVSLRTGPGRGEGDLTKHVETDRTLFTNEDDQRAFIEMWRSLANDYRLRRNVVGYDLLVEPHDAPTWPAIAQRTVDAIRTVDPSTAIVIETDAWSAARALATFPPLRGDRLVYAVHQYEPYAFTHEAAASWSPAELAAPFAAIDAFHRPVFVNELGVLIAKTGSAAFLEAELAQLESRGLDHAVWLWEVADESGYRAFDVRSSPAMVATLRANWSRNTVYADTCR
jgi:hypothetical protein